MPACHAGGRGFEPLLSRQFFIGDKFKKIIWLLGQAVKTPPFHGGNRGSIPLGVTIYGSIAQLGEHLPYKQRVTGSIPVVPTTYGSVAQLVRVPACHAGGRGFEPLLSRQFFIGDKFKKIIWLLGQAVKTPPFHGGNRGSIPLGVTIIWEHSSAGRASALQAEGHRFDPCCSHHIWPSGSVG